MNNQFSFGHILFSTHLDNLFGTHVHIFEYLIYAIVWKRGGKKI